jgi:hypothetical protein
MPRKLREVGVPFDVINEVWEYPDPASDPVGDQAQNDPRRYTTQQQMAVYSDLGIPLDRRVGRTAFKIEIDGDIYIIDSVSTVIEPTHTSKARAAHIVARRF